MLNLTTLIRDFKRSESGNVVVTAATVLPVVLLLSTSAMDYNLMTQSNQALTQAANAAALAAVNEAQIAFNNSENVDLKELMQVTALKNFRSRTSGLKHAKITKIKITPEQKGNRLSANVEYAAQYDSKIMGVVKKTSFNLSNSQRAVISTASYLNVALVFDGSASMGVGATTYDQSIMQSSTGCTFACHGSSYNNARAAGATMRIDVARKAAADSIQVIKANTKEDDQVTFGIYKYGGNITKILDHNSNNAANLNFVESEIRSKVYLQPTLAGTDTEGALSYVASQLPNSGSGRTPSDRVQYIVVLTDGVEDARHGGASHSARNSPYYSSLWAPGTSGCKAIRDRGINIVFIQTEYLTPTIGAHQNLFQWIDSNLNPILKNRFAACAGTADNVYQTTTPMQIQQAFMDVMGEISTPLRLY